MKWIKIDGEGAEYEVLKGAINMLSESKDIPLLIIIHQIGDDEKTLYQPIRNLLNNYNFKKNLRYYKHMEKDILFYLNKNNCIL